MNTDMNFYERYESYPDSRIIEILKDHKNYQEVAIDAAVKIAIERGLIHSEQDLMAPEFQNVRTSGFKLFPPISDNYQRQRLIASMFRFLYLVTLIPLIYGILSYARGELDMTFIGIGAGLFWGGGSLLLSKTRKQVYWTLLLTELLIIAAAIGQKVFAMNPILIQDLVVLIIGILLPLYILFYLKNLIR
jgi:hypothetical protein